MRRLRMARVPRHPTAASLIESRHAMTTADSHLTLYSHYARMRAESPVYFNPESEVWEVYGYHDIQTVLGDPATFSSNVHSAAVRTRLQTMVTMDPPRHTQIRKLISGAFTSKVIASLEPRIQAISNELIDQVAATGVTDLMSDFAFPLPVTVIAELLGTPASDRDKFKHWSELAVQGSEMTRRKKVPEPHMLEAVEQLSQYLDAIILERRAEPRDDLISGLVAARVNGEQLTPQEINNACRLLLIAGFETTTNLIGNTMHLLLLHPDAMARLRADPELVPTAIEESLRHTTPFQYFSRIATRDVALGGRSIQAGQQLMVFNGSGNRDEAAFPDPERFDLTREPNRHLSFGYGIHLCLGAGLARLEAKIAINTLLRRLPEIRFDQDKTIESVPSNLVFGLRCLPVRFSAAAHP